MIVNVKSLADMKKYTAHLAEGGNMEIPEGTTVGEVLKKLKVPAEPRKLAIVNGRHRPFDHILQQGDHLVFFPATRGGIRMLFRALLNEHQQIGMSVG